jgi:hypothetical protein
MAKFTTDGKDLFIDGKKVIKAWESFTGWFWFAIEKAYEQESLIDGEGVDDTIWYGLVQGLEEEWGYFSQAEIESLGLKAWRIPAINLPHSGRRL